MKKCNCLELIETSDKPLRELQVYMCDEHIGNFWNWIGRHPDL